MSSLVFQDEVEFMLAHYPSFLVLPVGDRKFFSVRYGERGLPTEITADIKNGLPFVSIKGNVASGVPLSNELLEGLHNFQTIAPTLRIGLDRKPDQTVTIIVGANALGPIFSAEWLRIEMDAVAHVTQAACDFVLDFGGIDGGTAFSNMLLELVDSFKSQNE
jgi:hypothetical protein